MRRYLVQASIIIALLVGCVLVHGEQTNAHATTQQVAITQSV